MPKEKLSPKKTLGFLQRLWPRVRPYRGQVILASILMLFSMAVGLSFPLFVRNLLDSAFLAGDGAMLNRIALFLFALFAMQAVMNFGQSYFTAAVSERVVADLRRDVFDALVRQPPGFFATKRVGEFSSRLASDAGLIHGVLRFGIPEMVRQGVFLPAALVVVTLMHPQLALVALTAIPLAVVVGWYFGRRVRRISTRIQDLLAASIAQAEQVFTQIRTVQSFTRETWESGVYGGVVNEARDEGLERAVARATLTGVVTFVAFGTIVMVLWEGGRLVLSDELTAGTLIAFLLYAVTISGAITSLAGFWSNLQEAAGAARRVFEVLDTPVEITSPIHPTLLPDPSRGVVAFEGVTFRYGPNLPQVLRGIDLSVAEGETVAIVGTSGAGKSTLVALLPRFFDVEDGRVTLDGVDVREAALDQLRRRIGMVPQEPMLFAGTVKENLLYGNLQATDADIEEAARAAHAYEFIMGFPDGFEQEIGERGVTLSAGQRQRIAIARIVLERPKILVLDEASSSLDAESEALVQDALERLMAGRTTLVIAHRLSTVIRAERILVLDNGVIVEQGTHAELLQHGEVYDRLYRRQFEDALATTEVDGA